MPERFERFRTEPRRTGLNFLFPRAPRSFTEARSIEIAKKLFKSGVTIGRVSIVRDAFGNQYRAASGGSGFVATREGWIMTNDHVAAGASQSGLEVWFSNEDKPRVAHLIGRDQAHDLALLRVEGRVSVAPLKLGDSGSVVPGQSVRVFGNPFSTGSSLRQGIVGSCREYVDPQTGKIVDGLIQTDAAMNPGNSGGPMVDAYGEVIGINRMIFSQSGGSQGVNFGVPSMYAKELIRKTRKQLRRRK